MIAVDLKFPDDDTWTSVTHLIRAESYTQELQIMNDDHESVIDTVSFKMVYDRLILAKFMQVGPNQKILMRSYTEAGDPDFFGYIAATVEHKKDEFLQDISVEVRDNSWRLDTKLSEDFQLPDSIDATGVTVSEFFSTTVLRAGYTFDDIDPSIITAPEIIRMVSEKKGKSTYRKLLDQVLRDYGYVVTTTAEGRLSLYKWLHEIIQPIGYLTTEFSTVKPFSLKKTDEVYDGINLSWTKAEILEEVCLYQDSLPIGSDGIPTGVIIAPGGYYPEDGDITDTYQQYRSDWLDRAFQIKASRVKNEDISLISSDGQYLVYHADEGISVTASYESYQAKVLFHNPTSEPLKLYIFEIWGRALFRSKIQKTMIPAGSVNPKDEHAVFLYEAGDAEILAKGLYRALHYGDIQYDFVLYERTYSPGDIVHIKQTDPAIDTDVVIHSITWTDEVPGFYYTARGISEYGDIEAITTSYMQSKIGEKGDPGDPAITLIVVSTNGNIFRPQLTETTLEARVYQGDQEITDTYDPSRFRWTRKSDDATADEIWNSAHYSIGGKSIQITDDDVEKRATFFCELL